ncbi:MAG: hypothetical protein JXQ30_10425 [Spirochaetes bacterium]|nr:hypothetical protein [Spirochaetota bacterium]
MNQARGGGPREELLGIFKGKVPAAFCETVLLNSPVTEMMEQCGAGWPRAHYDGTEMAELAAQIHRSTGFNAVNLPWDACVELEALGGSSIPAKSEVDVPTPAGPAFEDPECFTVPKDIFERGRFPIVFDAVRRVRNALGKEVAVVPLVEGPMNIACLSIGLNRMYRLVIRDPGSAERVLERAAKLCIEYGRRLLNSGGDLLQVSDPFAQGLAARHFLSLLIPIYKRISREVEGPVFLHICGNTKSLLPHIPESGFGAFSYDSPAVRTSEAVRSLGGRMLAIGSVPTVSCLLEGSEQDVIDVSMECIREGVDILSPSCGLPPRTPLKNLHAMVEAIRLWNEAAKRRD